YVDASPYGSVVMGSIDTFAQMTAYSEMPKPQDFSLNVEEPGQYCYGHNMSPYNSTSDLVPPQLLSNASESGASVSSTMGSPMLNPNYAGEPWNVGLGFGPSMMQPDTFQEPFVAPSREQEAILPTDKMAGCVGESSSAVSVASSSSSSPSRVLSSSSASSSSSSSGSARYG